MARTRQFYSTLQCFVSLVGSMGILLLFAGVPQLVQGEPLSTGSFVIFTLGVTFVLVMIAGNLIINNITARFRTGSTEDNSQGQGPVDDKPPNYEDVLKSDDLPPDYTSTISAKPPTYQEDLLTYQKVDKINLKPEGSIAGHELMGNSLGNSRSGGNLASSEGNESPHSLQRKESESPKIVTTSEAEVA